MTLKSYIQLTKTLEQDNRCCKYCREYVDEEALYTATNETTLLWKVCHVASLIPSPVCNGLGMRLRCSRLSVISVHWRVASVKVLKSGSCDWDTSHWQSSGTGDLQTFRDLVTPQRNWEILRDFSNTTEKFRDFSNFRICLKLSWFLTSTKLYWKKAITYCVLEFCTSKSCPFLIENEFERWAEFTILYLKVWVKRIH